MEYAGRLVNYLYLHDPMEIYDPMDIDEEDWDLDLMNIDH